MVHRDSLRYLVARQVVVGRYHDLCSFRVPTKPDVGSGVARSL